MTELHSDYNTLALANDLLTCVDNCPQYHACGIWCGRASLSPRHCDWFPQGMPSTVTAPTKADDAAAPNTIYAAYLEGRAAQPPRSAYTPDVARYCREMQQAAEVLKGAALFAAAVVVIGLLLYLMGMGV